ncbi:MAG TPA: helix-turn-helix transcriptional regulator [Feifaniaceae bacterium]|nr:helix-turn-helix transcriptional regulator [Feifaniaceae bacterium]
MNTSRAVADRLLFLCNERNITVNRLSTDAAVRQSTVNDIVSGKTKNAGILTIKKLCDGLGISLADFFDTDIFRSLEQEIE